MAISGVMAPLRATGPCGEAQACASQALSLWEERGEGGGMEEGLRLQELSDSQAETGAASLFTPGGASDFTARVFWEKLSFPHLDGGRAQLLLPSLPAPHSHGCHAWGRCRRVLWGRAPSDFFPRAVLSSPYGGVTGTRSKDWECPCELLSSSAGSSSVFAGDELQREGVCRGPTRIKYSVV